MYKATEKTRIHDDQKNQLWQEVETVLNQHHWLEITEYISLAGSAVGSLVALLSQQVFYASAPLTVALSLNLINRYRWEKKPEKNQPPRPQIEQVLPPSPPKTPVLFHPVETFDPADFDHTDLGEVQRSVADNRESTVAGILEVRQQLSREIENLRVQVQTLSLSERVDLSGIDESIVKLGKAIAHLKRENRQTVMPYLVKMGTAIHKLQQYQKTSELSTISLQDAIAKLRQELDELAQQRATINPAGSPTEIEALVAESVQGWVEEISQQLKDIKTHNYDLILERDRSRALMIEALLNAEEQVIIVSPWLKQRAFKKDNLLDQIEAALKRNIRVRIGWGYGEDIGLETDQEKLITINNRQWFYHKNRDELLKYAALGDLLQLKQTYPNQLVLKLLGTKENFLICDSSKNGIRSPHAFAWLGTHSLLGADGDSGQPEIGLYTTDPGIIAELIYSFEKAKMHR